MYVLGATQTDDLQTWALAESFQVQAGNQVKQGKQSVRMIYTLSQKDCEEGWQVKYYV